MATTSTGPAAPVARLYAVALGLLGLTTLLAACGGGESEGATASPVSAAPVASLACGSVNPHLALGCNDGSPDMLRYEKLDEPFAVPRDTPTFERVRFPDCKLGAISAQGGYLLEASLEAVCRSPIHEIDDVEERVTLTAHAARKCGYGPQGSGATIRPTWDGVLTLADPGKKVRLDVTARSSRTAKDCTVTVDGVVGDPILEGDSRILSAFPAGGRSVPVHLSCDVQGSDDGLAVTGCFGFADGSPYTSPPVVDVTLELVFRVQRCHDC